MKIKKVMIQNFRSIKYSEFNFKDYTVCIGENNSGKTNLLRALKVFYEIDKDKFDDKTDYPKFLDNKEEESWIEIEYQLTENEYSNLKDEYKLPNNTLKVRKYLKSKEKVKSSQSNIYAYEHGALSDNLFYGAKNISQAKVGTPIYIPELTSSDNELKLTGPSVFRNLISFFMTKIVSESDPFNTLKGAFSVFNDQFKDLSKNEMSLTTLNDNINTELKSWDISFDINVNSPDVNDIVKNLLSHRIFDKKLGKDIEIKSMGQGFQRYLIYVIIKLSSKFVDERIPTKKEFAPDLYLFLFDEPEAFLHPQQQEILNIALKELSQNFSQQIVITTHSPIFISKNIEEISSFIRFAKDKKGITT